MRLVGPLKQALAKLGIELTYRSVDFSLNQQRMENFQFEMTTQRLPGSTAPGTELFDRFGSKAAATPGSANYWGLADPAVDALLQKVVQAHTRPELSAAMRALNRVLTHGHYSIPQWYGDAFFIGYRPAPLRAARRDPAVLSAGRLGGLDLVGIAEQSAALRDEPLNQ